VGFTDHGQEMMLTRREERYIADKDHLVVVLLEPYVQLQGGIRSQAGEEKFVGSGHPRGRAPQSFPVGIFPYGGQYLPDGSLEARQVHPVGRGLLLFRVF
jgi:hypothetical protein